MTALERSSSGIPVVAALQVLIELRQPDQIVVTNQSSARVWPRLARHPLDFHYNPSTMGGAIPFVAGLALAQPRRHVLVVSGDGSLLMSLGSLVTVIGTGVENLTIVVLDNGMYEVTGGQRTPATGTAVDFAAVARASGFMSVSYFDDLAQWQAGASGALTSLGPRFVLLSVQRTPAEYLSHPTPPLVAQLCDFRLALAAS